MAKSPGTLPIKKLRAEEANSKSRNRQLSEANTELRSIVLDLQEKIKKLKKKR